MLVSTDYGMCGVKSGSVFPDLVPFEIEVVSTLRGRVLLAVSQFRASGKEALSSLPLFEVGMVIGMFVLVSF